MTQGDFEAICAAVPAEERTDNCDGFEVTSMAKDDCVGQADRVNGCDDHTVGELTECVQLDPCDLLMNANCTDVINCLLADGGGEPPPEGTLAGKLGGQAWTFMSGGVNDFLSEDSDTFFTVLYGEQADVCGFGPQGVNHVFVAIPKEVGTFPFQLDRNLTFVTYEDGEPFNNVATEGQVVVEAIDDGLLSGSLIARIDSDNDIGGSFVVKLCGAAP